MVLWANVSSLMVLRYGSENGFRVVSESSRAISKGTMDRLKKQENYIRMDTLEELASFFGVEPWQLMVPNLYPSLLASVSQERVEVE